MRLFVAFAVFMMSGCFATTMGLHSGSMTYEASGLNAPAPMEAAAADLTSAQADLVRAQARAVETHPELLGGYGWNYGSYYGYGGVPRVDPNYYYPAVPASVQQSLGQRAADLESRTTELEHEATNLGQLLEEHVEEERSQP